MLEIRPVNGMYYPHIQGFEMTSISLHPVSRCTNSGQVFANATLHFQTPCNYQSCVCRALEGKQVGGEVDGT